MNAAHLCGALREGLPDLYDCAPAPRDGVRVRTPMLYPDGGVVDIFVLEREGAYTLTDFGETLGWLRMQTVNPRRTPRQQRLIDDVCRTLGVKLSRGQLVLRSASAAELGESVTRLAQAAVRVSDIWFTLRSRSLDSASEEVGEWLIEKKISYRKGVRRRGRSGQRLEHPLRDARQRAHRAGISSEHGLPERGETHYRTCACRLLRPESLEDRPPTDIVCLAVRRHVGRLAPRGLSHRGRCLGGGPMVPARRIRDDSQGRLTIPPRSVENWSAFSKTGCRSIDARNA